MTLHRAGKAVKVELAIYKDGKLDFKQKLKTFTNNFIKILECLLRHATAGSIQQVELINTAGSSYYFMFQGVHDPSANQYLANNTSGNDLPCEIQIGTDSTPESRDDYALKNMVMSEEATSSIVDGSLKFSATFTPGTDITVREVGLVKQFKIIDTDVPTPILLLRSVIAEYTMHAGTTYVVEITISFT